MKLEFVELLAKSNFSFLLGASHPEELVSQAKTLGYRGMGLADVNGLYGVVRAHQSVYAPSHFTVSDKLKGVDQPFDFHVGAEMQLGDGGQVALFPIDKAGYSRLCRLITLSKRESPKGFSSLTLEDLCEHSEGLIAAVLPPWNLKKLNQLKESFGEHLYLPVWKDYTWESLQTYTHACELERNHNFQLFVTNRPLMHVPERKNILDVLTCIMHHSTLKNAKTLLAANAERHLKPLSELQLLWADRPDLLRKTREISEQLKFNLKQLTYAYPQAFLPEGKTSQQHLRSRVEEGLKWRYPEGAPDKVTALAEKELQLIAELKYEDYFLTLDDICQFAKKQNIMHQGRGSAANSVVCFALGLTAVDPGKFELLFERFISKERGEPPDIDIDFESGRREEVIQYIYKRWGVKHAGMVATVICYRGRMALREVAKTIEVPLAIVDRLIKVMGREGFSYLLENQDELLQYGITKDQLQKLVGLSRQIIGFPRHIGIHTGGFVISENPLTDSVPVEKATMEGRYVVQWNKDDIDVLKMMKIDVLGLGMLEALRRTIDDLKRIKGIEINIAQLPEEDPKTYAMIQKADTVGVFQIESRAQMSLLPRLKPKNFYDLVVEVAIVRPGPLQGGMIHPYLRRRDGKEQVYYAHPDLRKVLGRTLGVPIFQEQIMQIASTVCGFTPGEADELRRVMSSSWKRKDVMEGLRHRLISGMLSHGLNRRDAEQIYQTIHGFASYGFPESHSASFALLTYASCYFKRHFPDIFVTSVLNSMPMGFYNSRNLIGDAQRHGVRFFPLDIQKSEWNFELEAQLPYKHKDFDVPLHPIRQGFSAVNGLRETQVHTLVENRKNHGPFFDLTDFVRRVPMQKQILLKMASADAFLSFGMTAREAIWKIQSLSLDPQSLLFGMEKENFSTTSDEELLPKEQEWDTMNREYQSQGFSLFAHPIGLLRPQLEYMSNQAKQHNGLPYTKSSHLEKIPHRHRVKMAGLLSIKQKPPTAKGFCFLTMEDETGFFNIVINPDVYPTVRKVINFYPLMELVGTVEHVSGVTNIKLETAKGLTVSEAQMKDLSNPMIRDWG